MQQKVTLNNQNIFQGIVSACLPPQVFKVHKVSGKQKRWKFKMRGCQILGAIRLGEKHKKASKFSQKTSVWGKLNYSSKKFS